MFKHKKLLTVFFPKKCAEEKPYCSGKYRNPQLSVQRMAVLGKLILKHFVRFVSKLKLIYNTGIRRQIIILTF